MVGQQLAGFAIWSELNQATADVHFLYTDPALPGIFQTILKEICAQYLTNYNFVNLEQDLGIPGIRVAKLSYHPQKLEKKFEITARATS